MMLVQARRFLSQLSRIPANLDQKSLSVSQIIGFDHDPLLTWASRLAVEALKQEYITATTTKAREAGSGVDLAQEFDWAAAQKRASEAYKQYRAERGAVGKRIHNTIESMVAMPNREELMRVFDFSSLARGNANDLEVIESTRAFAQWWSSQAKFTNVQPEYKIESKSSKFHGRADAFARDENGKLCLLEFKTKFGDLDPSVQLQCAAYVAAYNEMHAHAGGVGGKDACAYALVVQIMFDPNNKTSAVKTIVYEDMSAALALFQCQNLAARLKLLL